MQEALELKNIRLIPLYSEIDVEDVDLSGKLGDIEFESVLIKEVDLIKQDKIVHLTGMGYSAHRINTKKEISSLRKEYGDSIIIIVHDVSTSIAAGDLVDWGANAIMLDHTSLVPEEYRIPMAASIMDISRFVSIKVIAEVSRKEDAAKALALGADFVVLRGINAADCEDHVKVCFAVAGAKNVAEFQAKAKTLLVR